MEVVVFGKIFDAKVFNSERKGGLARGVVPEAGGVFLWDSIYKGILFYYLSEVSGASLF